VKFQLKPLERKSTKLVLEMETEVFLRRLGLLFQYIEEWEVRVTEEHPCLGTVRALYAVA
jgi:hypothetical protein